METSIFPMWADFTPEFAERRLGELLPEAEAAVSRIEASNASTYEGCVLALDDATRGLWRCWGMVMHMVSVMNSDGWRRLQEAMQPRIVEFSLRVGQSKPIYEAAKRILPGLDGTRGRIVEKMVQGAEHSGVGLDGERRGRFNAVKARLAQLQMEFHNAVLDATKSFKFVKDGKTYTIDDANYPETMKHCPDREVREALFRGRATRAPENEVRIAEILKLRKELASLLGFDDYASLSISTKSAPSVAAVFSMFDELDAATEAPAREEAAELGDGVMPWDVTFAAERLRERKYSYSEDELKRHFEFADVLNGLFRLTKFLFDVDVQEVADVDKPQVWHPDVRFFQVEDNGGVIAHFYLDPYVRNGLKSGGAWMNDFANRNDRRGTLPLAVLCLNLPEPDAAGRTFMPFREVETLFHEFGHSLQCMLTRVDEEDAAGINLVEWDAVEVASQFMENWCLDARTGIEVPSDLKAKVVAARNFRAAYACRRQLSFAKTDMLLHGAGDAADANAVKEEVFSHFGLATVPEDRFLNAFTHIFAGGYAAGYYGYKWSEVMSADCYGAFEEAGLGDDAAVKRVGKQYRDTVLALGGSLSAYDVFRLFRGREPSAKALLRQTLNVFC